MVSKEHKEAKQLCKYNYHILLIGHKNHPEVIGTMDQITKQNIVLIETIVDAKNLKLNGLIAYVTQPTLSVDDTTYNIKVLEKKFPGIKPPIKEDICYATHNRQNTVTKIDSTGDKV